MDFKLNNGTRIPGVGLGTWKAKTGLVGEAVKTALEVGYRHIDCASIYGNEKEIGKALQEALRSGIVKREDLWITSKLWCTDHDPEEVPKAIEQTLKDLQLAYLDLYLIHWPVHLKKGGVNREFAPLNIPATWQAMEKLVDSGTTRGIGVSNFSCKKLGELLAAARIPPAVNQVECRPLWHQKKLRDFCFSNGVHLSGYSPLGSSGTTDLEDPTIKEVASKLGRSPAQIALRWGLQSGNSVLPKSTNAEHIKSNFQVINFSIPDEELSKLESLSPQKRVVVGNLFVNERSPYKSMSELWDGEI